jgi:hypothetical protein
MSVQVVVEERPPNRHLFAHLEVQPPVTVNNRNMHKTETRFMSPPRAHKEFTPAKMARSLSSPGKHDNSIFRQEMPYNSINDFQYHLDYFHRQRAQSDGGFGSSRIQRPLSFKNEKYLDYIKYGNFNWGPKYPPPKTARKSPRKSKKKKELSGAMLLEQLLRQLKRVDWAESPVYKQYLEHGRWKHTDEEIYSEIEIKYLSSTLQTMMTKEEKNQEEFDKEEGPAIINKHWDKTILTLQRLMLQMNLTYYFERFRLKLKLLLERSLSNQSKNRLPNLHLLEKLMARCLKMYEMIDHFMKVFKLIHHKEQMDEVVESQG